MESLLALCGAAGGVATMVWLFISGARKRLKQTDSEAATVRTQLITDLGQRVELLEAQAVRDAARISALEVVEGRYLQLVKDIAVAMTEIKNG